MTGSWHLLKKKIHLEIEVVGLSGFCANGIFSVVQLPTERKSDGSKERIISFLNEFNSQGQTLLLFFFLLNSLWPPAVTHGTHVWTYWSEWKPAGSSIKNHSATSRSVPAVKPVSTVDPQNSSKNRFPMTVYVCKVDQPVKINHGGTSHVLGNIRRYKH